MTADEEAIRERAYRLWEERGRPEGGAEEDWYAAEEQLRTSAGEPDASDADVSSNLVEDTAAQPGHVSTSASADDASRSQRGKAEQSQRRNGRTRSGST